MSQPYIGQIIIFPYTFAPRGWAFCEGQLMSIAQSSALFSIIGTTYGGNGTTNFALPKLSERVALHEGQGPGLSNYVLGEVSGVTNVTLSQSQLPAHNHQAAAGGLNDATKRQAIPVAGGWFGQTQNGKIYSDTAAAQIFAPSALSTTGGNQPHDNLQPFLCLHYCIAVEGVFPSRN